MTGQSGYTHAFNIFGDNLKVNHEGPEGIGTR